MRPSALLDHLVDWQAWVFMPDDDEVDDGSLRYSAGPEHLN